MAVFAMLGDGRAQDNEAAPTENATSIITLPPAFTETPVHDDVGLEKDVPIVTEVLEDDALAHLQRAQIFAENGNDQAAAEEYLLAGEKFLEQGMPFEASKALVEGIILQGGPNMPASRPQLGMLAEALYFSVPHDEFDSFIEELEVSEPRWPFIHLLEARSLLLNGEFARAERMIQDTFEREPDTLLAATVMAELKFVQGNYNEALEIVAWAMERPRAEGWLFEVLKDLEHSIEQALE